MDKVGRVIARKNMAEADHLKAHYVCSVCWRTLLVKHDSSTTVRVECSNPNCQGGNFVTAKYAERRQKESQVEIQEAKINLRGIIKDPQTLRLERMSSDELLKGLMQI